MLHCQAFYLFNLELVSTKWGEVAVMLLAVVMRKVFEYFKLDIDMSSAFDTIKKSRETKYLYVWLPEPYNSEGIRLRRIWL